MEKRRLGGILSVCINTRRGGLERTEALFSRAVTGTEEMDTD